MKRVMGGLVFLFGLTLAAWIAYNLLIERLPETRGHSPIPALIMSGAFLYVGFKWMRARRTDATPDPRQGPKSDHPQ